MKENYSITEVAVVQQDTPMVNENMISWTDLQFGRIYTRAIAIAIIFRVNVFRSITSYLSMAQKDIAKPPEIE